MLRNALPSARTLRFESVALLCCQAIDAGSSSLVILGRFSPGRLKQEALLNSYVSSSSQDLSGESGAEDDLPAGPMDIDDSSFSHQMAPAGRAQTGPGADQDMNEVAEILLKISNVNMNGNRQRRYASTQANSCHLSTLLRRSFM